VVWRGRCLTLRVALAEVEQAQVVFRSRFDVRLPLQTPDDARAALVQAAVEGWMQQRAHAEAKALVARFAVQAGVQVRRVEVRPMLRLWGSCGRDGVIRLDTGFMRLPAELGAYLCAHEVAHLVHRDHSAAFWRVLRTLVPDARRRHEALMAHGRTL
jgi:predicted metal-dependent hydrolase